jgi:myo-inositol-hexaphosphate 3-phosphohydrolase
MLHIELNQLRSDIRTKTTGGITMDELNKLYLGTNKELNIWKYIAEAIEKSI